MSRAGSITGTAVGQELAKSQERPRIVHILTQLQTTFGVLDAQGNIIQRLPVTADITMFGPAQFAEAYNIVTAKRLEFEAQIAKASAEDAALKEELERAKSIADKAKKN